MSTLSPLQHSCQTMRRSFSSLLARSAPSMAASPSAVILIGSTRPALIGLTSVLPIPPGSPTMNTTATATFNQPVRYRSTRSTRGLYDGKDVAFGNNVPFSLKKTRRRWNPNLQYKRVYSEILDEMIPFHLTTSALRTIDKMGGLDEYLLHSKHVSTKGEGEGQRVRNRLIQKIQHREMLKQCAIERGENVDDWDRIVLEGKKIRQQAAPTTPQSSSSSSLMEES